MKEKIIKAAKSLVLGLLKWLSKQDNKYGKASKELLEVMEKIELAAKDGVISEQEIREISKEGTDLIVSVVSLFAKVEIKLKKK